MESWVTARGLDGSYLRRYYSFSYGRWYRGSYAGYVIGCNLGCVFCWATFKDRLDSGKFYSPAQVVEKLIEGGRRWGARVLRLSGGEPTVGFDHLLEVVKLFGKLGEGRTLIVETNGILLGYSRTASEELASRVAHGTVLRVSIKGATPQDFEKLTGAPAEYFDVQLRALENLVRAGLEPGAGVTVAVMASFSEPRDLATLLLRLASVDPKLAKVAELEVVKLYPKVRSSLERVGLRPRWYIEPGTSSRKALKPGNHLGVE